MADQQGTDLYRRVIAYDYGRAETTELTKKVWDGTPWMVDVYIGSADPRNGDRFTRYAAMVEWLHDNIGDEAWPIHGRAGLWHRGGAAINGWNWIGFAREEDMQRFLAAWPPPDGVIPGTPVEDLAYINRRPEPSDA